jgi:Ca-activated chloride channel homolog
MSSPASLVLERMLHRQSIAVPGESLATYALLKLIPTGESVVALPMTLALCIDVSGSMYWGDGTGKPRLDRVREAAIAAIGKLKPTDRLALVAFGNGAEVVLPPTPVTDREKIDDTLRRIDMFSVDQAGTAMDEGIRLAFDALTAAGEAGRQHQIVVLTDGETSGEGACRELATRMFDRKVRFSIMGVGTEWNSHLVKDLAKLSDGRWYYIDAESADETMRVFATEFDRAASTAYTNVAVEFKPMKDIKIKRLRQVVPTIREIAVNPLDDRLLSAVIGTLDRSTPAKFILDLSVPKRPDGKYVLAQVDVKFDLGDGKLQSTGAVPLELAYTAAGAGYVNAEVARHIDEVQIYELNANLQSAIANEDTAEVRKLAENISRKATVLGPRGAKKTQLALQVLSELDGTGTVSKRTMLAVDDAVRVGAE